MTDHSHIVAIVERLGLTVSSVFVPFSHSRNAKPAKDGKVWRSLNWSVTILRADRDVLTLDYSAGEAHCPSYADKPGSPYGKTERSALIDWECENGRKASGINHGSNRLAGWGPKAGPTIEPKALDVLHSLVMDASVLDHATFDSWAADYGYDTDSRSAESTYRLCLSHALALRSAIGEAGISELQEAFSDY